MFDQNVGLKRQVEPQVRAAPIYGVVPSRCSLMFVLL